MLVAIDTGSRRPVKILRARPTRHFLFLLVRCRCGKKFGHRADRPSIVCYHCGRMAALRDLRVTPGPWPAVAAPAKSRGREDGGPARPAASSRAGGQRRKAVRSRRARAKRQSAR